MSTWRAGQLRSPTVTVTDGPAPEGSPAVPMPTVMSPSSSKRTRRTPALVATGRSSPLARPARWRYLAKTRTPFPHISAMLPSALR